MLLCIYLKMNARISNDRVLTLFEIELPFWYPFDALLIVCLMVLLYPTYKGIGMLYCTNGWYV